MMEIDAKRTEVMAQLARAQDVLKAQLRELRAELPAILVSKPSPRSLVSVAERAKIIQLHRKGYSAVDISSVTGRSRRTVSSVIQRYRESLTDSSKPR